MRKMRFARARTRWRSIMEMHEQAIVIVDQKLDVRFVNRAAEALFAKPSHDLIGAPFGYPMVDGENHRDRDPASASGHRLHGDAGDSDTLGRRGTIPFVPPRHVEPTDGPRAIFESCFRRSSKARHQWSSPTSRAASSTSIRSSARRPVIPIAEVVGKNPRILKSGHTTAHEYETLWRTISRPARSGMASSTTGGKAGRLLLGAGRHRSDP